MNRLITLFILLPFIVLASASSESEGLKIIKASAYTDPRGNDKNDLVLNLVVQNTSKINLTILTKNLQSTTYAQATNSKISIDLSGNAVVNGQDIIPSLYDYSPVILKPGEITSIKQHYTDRKDLKQVILEYDMLNKWSERFSTWRGRIQSDRIAILKRDMPK